MKTKTNGGAAFPFEEVRSRVGGVAKDWANHKGMSLRDYFAAMAMQGAMANCDVKETAIGRAEWAYEIADAMLKEREK